MGIFERILQHARRFPAQEALVSEHHRICYGDLPGLIEGYETCLLANGIGQDSTVGIAIKEQIPHLLICLALLKIGARQVALASHDSEIYRDNLCKRLHVSHVVGLDEHFDPIRPLSRHLQIERRRDASPVGEAGEGQNRESILYATTSGTTGKPRIVAWTERCLILQFSLYLQNMQDNRFDPMRSGKFLISSSIEHNVFKRHVLRSLYNGTTKVFAGAAAQNSSDLMDMIAKERIAVFVMSVSEAKRFSGGDRCRGFEGVSIHVGGMRISWNLRKAILSNLSERLYVNYGSTETSRISMAAPGEHDERECVGAPLKGVTVEIVGEDDRPLPPNEVGEIRIRAPGMVDSYFDTPAETAARFRDGWFYPGDMAQLTDEGQLIIHGRKDDMMILSTTNIYPSEIERVFEAHPDVAAAAAFPIKSRVHGDIPAVALELVKGSQLGEQDLMQYARDQLGVRSPRKAIILDALPKNAGGKVLKTELAATLSHQPEGDD